MGEERRGSIRGGAWGALPLPLANGGKCLYNLYCQNEFQPILILRKTPFSHHHNIV
jgi:hypothetical protein